MRKTDEEFVREVYRRYKKRRSVRLRYIKFAPLAAACLLVCIGLGVLKLQNTHLNKVKFGATIGAMDGQVYENVGEKHFGTPESAGIETGGELTGMQGVTNITAEYFGKRYEITDGELAIWLDGIEECEPAKSSDGKMWLKVSYKERDFIFFDSDDENDALVLVGGKYYTADKEMILKIISKLH